MGMISTDDMSNIVDRSKIRRERVKTRSYLKKEIEEIPGEQGIYFDGRKDRTLVMIKEGERIARKTITQEHIVIVTEPGSKYLGHVTPATGSSQNIKTSILTFLEKNFNLSKLKVIGIVMLL